jgi:uncharacterized protein (DUF302 family)
MKIIVDSDKTVEQVCEDLEAAVKRHKFGVLHVHDLQKTLQSKGLQFDEACRVYEVCNPHKAQAVLNDDLSLNMALPCRISVWSEKGRTRIGMISPRDMLALLSDSPVLRAVADEVEDTTRKIIEEAS